jgi:hypothetical protein
MGNPFSRVGYRTPWALTTRRNALWLLTGYGEPLIENTEEIRLFPSSSPKVAGPLLASCAQARIAIRLVTGGDMTMKQTTMLWAIAIAIVGALMPGAAQAPPSPDQLVAALKQNLAESQKKLRQYEWIETTAISLKGEEKSRKQQRVYYGADGKLTKVPMGEPKPAAEPSGGGRGRRGGGRVKENIIENKVEDMVEYMGKATALIQKYVPPNPELIQKAKDAKNLAVAPQPDGKVRLAFKDYVQPKDSMNIDVDAKAALLSAINVATYLEKPEDTVTLDVRFGTLADGTSYTSQTTLEAKAKNIRVVVENSGHRPLAK